MTRKEAQLALGRMAELPADWDDAGGLPVTPAALALAKAVLGHPDTTMPSWLSPLACGGIQLEYQLDEIYLDAVCTAEGKLEVFASSCRQDASWGHIRLMGMP